MSKKITVNILNPDNSINLENKEIEAYVGININGTLEEIPFGRFIIQRPESEEVKEKTTFTGYDYMQKFNKTYIDNNNYPIALGEYLQNLCSFIGIELGTDITKLINKDYSILGNPFTNNEDCKTVLSNIAQLCGGFAKIGRDNKLYIITLDKNETVEEIDGNNYMEDFSRNEEYGEVNSLIIRLSQVEGENTTRQDEESVTTKGLTEITIADNYFLIDQIEREKIIGNLWNLLKGLKYLPFSTTYYGYPYLDIGDYITILDSKDNEYKSYIFNHSFTFNGGFSGKIDTKALTKTQTAYKNTNNLKTKFKNVEYKVDKINGKITQLIQETSEHEEKITQQEQTIEDITSTVASKDEVKEQINELRQTIEGTTNTLTNTGGNNIFYYNLDYWDKEENTNLGVEEYSDTDVKHNTVSKLAYKTKNGIAEQQQMVKNGIYTISFLYKKLIEMATGYVEINETQYSLDSENINEWKEQSYTIEITTNTIDIKIVTDTDNSFIIADLMVANGSEKMVWSQNPNETITDTVTIGKGIQVESSSSNTYTRIDADGNRTFNGTTDERVAEMTDKGVYSKTLEVENEAKINNLFIQKVDNQVWLTGIGG